MDKIIDLRPGRFWSYDAIFQIPISPTAKLVYLYLCAVSNKNGSSFPGYRKIARACGLGRSTVIEKIKELIDYNIIQKDVRFTKKGQTSNLYYLLPLSEWKGVQNLDGGSPKIGRDGVQNLHPKEVPFKEDKNKRQRETESDFSKEIEKIKATTFGKNIPEKHLKKLIEQYGFEETYKACKVLSFQETKVKNPYAYLKKILKDGGVVEPEGYMDPEIEEKYKKINKDIDAAAMEIFKNPEINEFWSQLSKTEKEKFKKEVSEETKKILPPEHLTEEKRKIIAKGLVAIAKIKAFKAFKQGGVG